MSVYFQNCSSKLNACNVLTGAIIVGGITYSVYKLSNKGKSKNISNICCSNLYFLKESPIDNLKYMLNDKEVVLKAVKQDGIALEYAGEGLKDDKEVVLKAVQQDGRALIYASERLKKSL